MFGFTAIFSAVFFGSIDYIGTVSATDSDLSVTLEPVISLRVAKDYNDGNGYVSINELDLSVTPTASGAFAKDDLSVLVSTSNETGYTLTLANNDTDTAMHHTESTITTTIPTLTALGSSADYTESTFTNNSWGYGLGAISDPAQTFSPIPLSTAPATIKTTTTPTGSVGGTTSEDQTNVTFATKIDASIPAGTYQDTVVFSATTNYVPPATANVTIAPITTEQLAGGETFTLDTDIDWLDNIGQMIVTLYPANNVADTATCTNPQATNNNGYLRVTCTSPARTEGTYNVKLELFRFNQEYIASNTITYELPSFRQIVQARYENADGTWGAYSNVIDADYKQGSTVSWSEPASTIYQAASITSYTVTEPKTTQVSVYRNDFTVTWNGNGGSSPSSYTRNYGQAIGALPTTTRADYTFTGWYNTSATTGGTQATTTTTITANTTYWARWTPTTIANITYMQDITSTICTNTAVNTTATLTDRRDSKTYTIRKMSDNRCWMTQNLRLTGPLTLTSTYSNVTSNFALPASSDDFGRTNSDAADVDIPRLKDYSGSNSSYGVYYNWYTATASTGTYAMTSGNATASVCPSRWKLPTDKDFQTLYNVYGSRASFVSATSVVLSGYFTYRGAGQHGSNGQLWASTATSDAGRAGLLFIDNSSVSPQDDGAKNYGRPIRCVVN